MPKSVLIVTMHRGNNYGSALQTFALSEKIKEFGCDAVILDYIPDRINEKQYFLNAFKKLLSPCLSFHDRYLILRGLVYILDSKICYDRFFKENLRLTKKYNGIESVFKDIPFADIYLTGSDQVWNSVYNRGIDPVFFLSFAPEDKPKSSYSASFGREKLEEWELDETKAMLKRYNNISVRERSALDVLKSIGIFDGQCVLDPTFLLNRDDWRKRLVSHGEKNKYVLIYSVEPDKHSIIKIARSIADKIGAKVYMVEWGKRPYPGVDKMLGILDPLMLIDYFDKAEFIVASSFHGTALSINLNKQFISIAPAKFETRVRSILSIAGLEDRLIASSDFVIDMISENIDYHKVNDLIDAQRKESVHYLSKILQ